MILEQGNILGIYFKNDDYLKFLNDCFSNFLITGVDVKLFGTGQVLFVKIAAPGIDRINEAVKKHGGEIVI
jgi:hypothetical protein